MTQRSVAYLKTRFETADIPTQSDYQDVFDSFVNLEASATQTLSGALIAPALDATRVSAVSVSAQNLYPKRTYFSNTPNVSAGAGTQAGGTKLLNDQNHIFGNDILGFGVVLASCEPGRVQYLTNTNTTVLTVFPASGCNFIGSAENAPISLAKNSGMIITHQAASAYGVFRGTI